jgi:four helix bundle protein
MTDKIRSYTDLRVFQNAMEAATKIFELTRSFPDEEKFSMTDQMRGSSRSVCSNLSGAWRNRRHKDAFVAKLNDAESQACETQVWVAFARKCKYLEDAFARKCKYLEDDVCDGLHSAYDLILAQLVKMINEPYKWLIKKSADPPAEED